MSTNRNGIAAVLAMAVAGAALAGCATTPAERSEKNAAAVATWPADVQAKVKAGEAAVGFTAEQVRVALGDPDRITAVTDAKGEREVWSYAGGRRARLGIGVGVGGGSGYGGVSMSGGGRRGGEMQRVTFEGGRVVEIEQSKPGGRRGER